MVQIASSVSVRPLPTFSAAISSRMLLATQSVAAITASATASAAVAKVIASLGGEGARQRWSRAPSEAMSWAIGPAAAAQAIRA
jgi:hypothetical protein